MNVYPVYKSIRSFGSLANKEVHDALRFAVNWDEIATNKYDIETKIDRSRMRVTPRVCACALALARARVCVRSTNFLQ